MNREGIQHAGVLGSVLGGLAFFAGSSTAASIGFASLGFLIGSAAGYWITARRQLPHQLKVTRPARLGGQIVKVVAWWAFTFWGVIGIVRVGWDMRLIAATCFFAVGAVFVTYREIRRN